MPVINLKYNGLQRDLPSWEAGSRYTMAENIRFARGFAERVRGDSVLANTLTGGAITETDLEYAVNSFDAAGNYWNLLDNRTAYQRVSESTEYSNVMSDAGESAFWGALGGAVIGGAIAIVGGENVGETPLYISLIFISKT